MPPLPSREVLKSWKRADIQRLCKDYGVRANLKTEALIDLLVESQSAPPPSQAQQPAPIEPTTRRSSRAEASRTSSLIIHDIDEDGDGEDTAMGEPDATPPAKEPPPIHPPVTPSRTRKAKELQTSLGVGRPKAVGGSGARAVTRSSSSQKPKRAKSSRMLNRVEPTIQEEPEPSPSYSNDAHAGPSHTTAAAEYLENSHPANMALLPAQPMDTDSNLMSKQISNAVEPLQARMDAMQKDFNALDLRNTEIDELKAQLSNLEGLQERYAHLEAEVKELRSQSALIERLQQELRHLREGPMHPVVPRRMTTPPLPSTPRARSPRMQLALGVVPSAFKSTAYPPISDQMSPSESPRRASSTASSLPSRPGLAPTILGKRPRDSTGDMTGIIEDSEQADIAGEELATKVMRPNKKRPRLESDDADMPGPSRRPSNDVADQLAAPRIPSATEHATNNGSFGNNFADPPPPTEHLPEFFAPSSPTDALGTGDSSGENRDPFNLRFSPMSSTPVQPSGARSFMPPFPFPEPLHSPVADLSSAGLFARAHEIRGDIFPPFGSPSREMEGQQGATSEAGRRAGKQSEVSSNLVAAGLGLTMVRTGSSTDPMNYPEPPPAKRTMYGTELEGETRFGDFGVEGVASGFWSGR